MPDVASVPLTANSTGWLYQPFESGPRVAATLADGGVASYLSANPPEPTLPATSVHVPPPRPRRRRRRRRSGLEHDAIPATASVPAKANVTGWLYQPFESGPRAGGARDRRRGLVDLRRRRSSTTVPPRRSRCRCACVVPFGRHELRGLAAGARDQPCGSVTAQWIVTLLRYQPFVPAVPTRVVKLTVGRRSGGRREAAPARTTARPMTRRLIARAPRAGGARPGARPRRRARRTRAPRRRARAGRGRTPRPRDQGRERQRAPVVRRRVRTTAAGFGLGLGFAATFAAGCCFAAQEPASPAPPASRRVGRPCASRPARACPRVRVTTGACCSTGAGGRPAPAGLRGGGLRLRRLRRDRKRRRVGGRRRRGAGAADTRQSRSTPPAGRQPPQHRSHPSSCHVPPLIFPELPRSYCAFPYVSISALGLAGRPEPACESMPVFWSSTTSMAFLAPNCSAADRPIAFWRFFADWPVAWIPPPLD